MGRSSNANNSRVNPKVGQIRHDTYGEKRRYDPEPNLRTIRLAEELSNGFLADVLTDMKGAAPKNPRTVRLTLRTLLAGYELVDDV